MEEIQEVSLEPLPSSRYLAPMRMVYSQAGRPSRAWDLMRYHYNHYIIIIVIRYCHYSHHDPCQVSQQRGRGDLQHRHPEVRVRAAVQTRSVRQQRSQHSRWVEIVLCNMHSTMLFYVSDYQLLTQRP